MDNEADDVADSPKLAEAKARYAAFLLNNPSSKMTSVEGDDEEHIFISQPWGDQSLALIIQDDDANLLESLNGLYLPPRYTAIYHMDARKLEVIWTAYKLDDDQKDLEGRKFSLNLPNISYDCEFTDSSKRLLELAKASIPIEISKSGFRNLLSFHSFINKENAEGEDAEIDAYGKPLSFWISNLDWDDESVLNVIRHLNFYLRYYDAKSPIVEIHSNGASETAQKNRYFDGFEFPGVVHSPVLDTKLLIMYSSGFGSSGPTNFLNHYRVVEYVSFDFTHDTARKEIRSVISRPHALHDVEGTATELLLILKEIKMEREQEAIPKFMKEVIAPAKLWRELEPNKAFFVQKTEFEGGLVIDPIMTDKSSAETFGISGIDQFARACTKIRNGLAHGRDKMSADSILPTSRNFALLRPWGNALAFCAGEVVLYAGRH